MWRAGRAYFDRRHPRFRGGRLAVALRTDDPDVAYERHAVLVQLMDRGDWGVLEAIRRGDMHITDAQAALRDGDATKLRRMGSDSPRLGPAIQRFMRMKEATRSRRTCDKYRGDLEALRGELGVDFPMEELTVSDAREYLHAKRDGRGAWAPATQQGCRIVCGALWSMVMAEEAEAFERQGVQLLVRSNPWKKVETPEVRRTRFSFLTPEEWRQLDRATTGSPVRAIVALAFLAGLRRGEIIHLRPETDVALDGDYPLLRVQSRAGRWPWRPKTSRGERDVPLAPSLAGIIDNHIQRGYAGQRYLIRTAGRDEPIGAATITTWVREAFRRAGIKYGAQGDGLTLHSGRHTFASWLAQDGVSLTVVARLLGDTTQVVEQVYAHLVPDTFRGAIDRIEARVTG